MVLSILCSKLAKNHLHYAETNFTNNSTVKCLSWIRSIKKLPPKWQQYKITNNKLFEMFSIILLHNLNDVFYWLLFIIYIYVCLMYNDDQCEIKLCKVKSNNHITKRQSFYAHNLLVKTCWIKKSDLQLFMVIWANRLIVIVIGYYKCEFSW